MKLPVFAILLPIILSGVLPSFAGGQTAAPQLEIRRLNPPEAGFFGKLLVFEGIPIKAHESVPDEALRAGRGRLEMMFRGMGGYRQLILSRLAREGVELHIIGKDQVTTDLPEWRQDKGKHLAEYNGLTRDERTRGMGGKLVSCGEENLLRLETDRYRGRDICVHEFAHGIQGIGLTDKVRARFLKQYKRSLDKGLWKHSYAASNIHEYFAELSMWYFGTHGDMGMEGAKPADGPQGLRDYDPEAFALFDDLYSGRLPVDEFR